MDGQHYPLSEHQGHAFEGRLSDKGRLPQRTKHVIHTHHPACQTKVGSESLLSSSFIDSPLDGDGDGGVAGREEAHLREGDGVGDEVDEDVVAVRGDQRGQREAAE